MLGSRTGRIFGLKSGEAVMIFHVVVGQYTRPIYIWLTNIIISDVTSSHESWASEQPTASPGSGDVHSLPDADPNEAF